jgi:hypothetical protein
MTDASSHLNLDIMDSVCKIYEAFQTLKSSKYKTTGKKDATQT